MNVSATSSIRRILAVLACSAGGGVQAQMYLPDPRIEVDHTTNVYFGAIRDVDGAMLADVTVAVSGDQATYVMVTDAEGRYRIRVPKTLPATKLKITCTRQGYELKRIVRRPPPKGATSPVQADCVLAPIRQEPR